MIFTIDNVIISQRGNKISFVVLKSDEAHKESQWEDMCEKIISECVKLLPHDVSNELQPQHHTTLVALPQLEVFDVDKQVQIATFHPNYQFENTTTSDIGNWTNRAPYPIVHLLKVDDVTRAIDGYPGDTEDIWRANLSTLEQMGEPSIRELISSILEKSKRS